MALGTLTLVDKTTWGNRRIRTYDVQLTSGANYTTGGETVTPIAVGMGRRIVNVLTNPSGGGTTAYNVAPNFTAVVANPGAVRLQGLVSNGASPALFNEAPSNTNLSANTARITFIGY